MNAGTTGAAPRRIPGRLLFWILLLLAAYFLPRGEYSNPDSHLALSYALVEQHTVRIDRYLEMSGTRDQLLDRAVYCGPKTGVATCHRYYSDKAPGVSLVVAAVYAAIRPLLPPGLMPTAPGSDRFVLRFLLTLLAISVPCAAFLVLYWRFLSGLVGQTAALIVAVAYGFGSMALPFSTLMFSHALSAALLFGAFMLLFRALPRPPERRHGATRNATCSPPDAHGALSLALAGLCAGYAVSCEYPAAIIAGLLGLYVLVAEGSPAARAGRLARYALGVLAGLVPLFVYNQAAFGNPLALGYAHLTSPQYAAGMARGLLGVGLPMWSVIWGTTFSPYRGLFILSPWLLLAFPGFVAMARAGLRREAWLCATICACYFIFQSGYAFWDGGASVGPRHFLPALPFLAFPVAFVLQTTPMRRLARVLIAFSVAMLLLTLVTDPAYVTTQPVPFVDITLHDLATGKIQNNWGMLFHLPGYASLLPLAAGLFVLGRRLWRHVPREEASIQRPRAA
jgi:hypothetical protein